MQTLIPKGSNAKTYKTWSRKGRCPGCGVGCGSNHRPFCPAREQLLRRINKTKSNGGSGRGYFGIGVYQPKTSENIGTLWRQAYLFGANFIFTIGRRYKEQCSDTVKASRHIPLWEFQSFGDFEQAMPSNSKRVFIELAEKAVLLPTYQHPERAIYILGSEDNGIPIDFIREYDDVVKIPQANEVSSSNVAVIGSILLYDRFVKNR